MSQLLLTKQLDAEWIHLHEGRCGGSLKVALTEIDGETGWQCESGVATALYPWSRLWFRAVGEPPRLIVWSYR